jgi:hypothetical protein
MSPLRWTLVALLVASTVVFDLGVIAERSGTDTHTEPAAAHATEAGGEAAEPEGAHHPSAESSVTASGEAAHADERERLLGVDAESTPLVVLAALAGLTLAAVAASRLGATRGFLRVVVIVGVTWAALDLREVIHQLDESRTAVAVIATAVAALHLAAATISGRLASQRDSPARALSRSGATRR